MRSLIAYADILTPNLTEACILAETEYGADMDEKELYFLCNKISELGLKKIMISGLECGDDLENFIYDAEKPPTAIREHKGATVHFCNRLFPFHVASEYSSGAQGRNTGVNDSGPVHSSTNPFSFRSIFSTSLSAYIC